MEVAWNRSCRPSTMFAELAILSICLLGVVSHVSSLPTERWLDSSDLDQDDLVEMPQEDAREGLKGSADSLSRVSRAKRDSMFLERTIFFTDDDGDDEEEQEKKDKGFEMDDEGTRTYKEEKEEQKKKEEAFGMIDEEKWNTGESSKKSNDLQKDTALSEENKAPDLDWPASENSPIVLPNPLADFIEQSRDFLIRYLDIENLLYYLWSRYVFLSGEQIIERSKNVDKWTTRRECLDAWLKDSRRANPELPLEDQMTIRKDFYLMYYFIRLYRPGLFPEVGWETDQDRYVFRPPVAPPDGKQSTSCRLHILHDILEHKTHFIEKMEKSTTLEKFFSKVTRNFSNEVDEVCKRHEESKQGFTTEDEDILRNGFWLHCLDYASEEEKLEFVKMIKEGQPQLFAENPLSELLAKLERTSPNQVCQPEKSSSSSSEPEVSFYRSRPMAATVSVGLERTNGEWRPEVKYNVHVHTNIPGASDSQEDENNKILTGLPFPVTGTWLVHWNTNPVMWDASNAWIGRQFVNSTFDGRCLILPAVGPGAFGIMNSDYLYLGGANEGDIEMAIVDRMGKRRAFTMRFKDEVGGNTTTWQLVEERK